MIKEKLDIDAKDAKILSLLMGDPEMSQTELATALKLSQPSVNVRIQKLKKKGVLAHHVGIEFNKTDMILARVDFTALDAAKVMEGLKKCSFFVNGFVMSGKSNASILIIGHDLKKIDSIVNRHLRADSEVKDIIMSVVVSTAKPFVCDVDISREEHEVCQYSRICEECPVK